MEYVELFESFLAKYLDIPNFQYYMGIPANYRHPLVHEMIANGQFPQFRYFIPRCITYCMILNVVRFVLGFILFRVSNFGFSLFCLLKLFDPFLAFGNILNEYQSSKVWT